MQTVKTLLTCLFLAVTAIAVAQKPYNTDATQVVTELMQLSTERTTVVILSAAIAENGVDRGSSQILAKTVDGVGNVIKIKAASDSMRPTNLTIFTRDGRVYRFLVEYNTDPVRDFFDYSAGADKAASSGVRFLPNRLDDAATLNTTAFVSTLPPHRARPASQKAGQMQMRIRGIYLSGGVLFFHIGLSNGSAIPYQLDFIRCYQKDRKKSKRTSQMEKEVTPLATNYHDIPAISAYTPYHSIVLAFEQFTIADNKFFMIEAFEKNGDRRLSIQVKGKDILKARPLLSR